MSTAADALLRTPHMDNASRTAYRYALYLAPAQPWWDVGSSWLGRCAATGQALERHDSADPRIDAWTRAPRLYGLHATLKPPFRLRDQVCPRDVDSAARALAGAFSAFDVPLRRRRLRGFMAWCLDEGDASAIRAMRKLADAAVTELDALRAPLTDAERARRSLEQLSANQRAMLDRWGYPYVLDEFTFHITLTNALPDAQLEQAGRAFDDQAGGAGLPEVMPVDAVSVYVQPEPGSPFVVARHYGFDGSITDAVGAAWLADVGASA